MARMADQPTPFDSLRSLRAGREYGVALAIVFAVILFRAAIFVFWERAHFDSDQAITGLMAKHLAEGRAFPVFYYGQSYMLAVESWLAAPLFLLFGTSVAVLKLPILGINFAIGWLLLRSFVRDVGLRPLAAVVPTMFFALPAPGTATRLVEANGGNVEPFLYVLLLWVLRARPVWAGVVFGIGFLHREFTLYGFIALAVVQLAQCISSSWKDAWTSFTRLLVTCVVAGGTWGFVQWVKRFSSGAGPGTSLADVYNPSDNISELTNRICIDPATAIPGFQRLATDHWPVLFGTLPEPLRDFGVVTSVSQGLPGAALLLTAIIVIALAAVVWARRFQGREFCAFLVLTALFSIGGYVVGRCGAIDFYYMRYELLSLLGAAGLSGWFLASEPANPSSLWRVARRAWLALIAAWFLAVAIPHLTLWNEYLRHPPEDIRRTIIAELDARHIRYAASRYWVAYALTFLTDERIVVKSSDFVRIREYEKVVDAHAAEMVRIEREPCPGGEEILPRVFFCRP